eukprot:4075628-Alexandrium_andersonii.AAC.1
MPPRAPVVRTRPWVGFDALLCEVPQPASPGVLLECRVLVPVKPRLSQAVQVVSLRSAVPEAQEPQDIGR